jgi:hypothetical protein
MTERDPSEPVPSGGEARGAGEPAVRPERLVEVVEDDAGPRPVSLRRAPRYRAFVGTGAVIGVVFAVLLTGLFPDGGRYSAVAVMGYLAAALALVGGLVGGAAAVLLERRR